MADTFFEPRLFIRIPSTRKDLQVSVARNWVFIASLFPPITNNNVVLVRIYFMVQDDPLSLDKMRQNGLVRYVL